MFRSDKLRRGANLDAAFERMGQRGLTVGSLINIGAGRGDDFPFFRKTWPDLGALLIDMDSRFEDDWRGMAKKYPAVKHIVCGAGADDREGYFAKTNDVGGALLDTTSAEAGARPTPIRKIDTLVREYQMPAPYFLKFDTHGVELDILTGAVETLKQTSLIMMEVYNFKLNFVGGRNLTFDEMSLHMKSLGFRCVDICDPLFRPGDFAFWQMHMIFIPESHSTWASNSYSGGARG